LLAAKADTSCVPFRCFLKIEILNPTPEAFEDFGLTSSIGGEHTYIPNDNLEWRSHDVIGPKSKLSIQDANALKIKVTYGYPIKVPLMARVIPAILCFQHVGLDAFDRDATQPDTPFDNCTNYYLQGRIPIVSYATVQMQTPAWKPEQQNQ
jgi:hypothetical protein